MAYTVVESKSLVNIKLAEIITEEETPRNFKFETATEADYSPVTSDGNEEILRTKNTIHGVDRTETIQYGSDIDLTDAKVSLEVLAIIDGGTLVTTGVEPDVVITGYDSPPVGASLNKTPFTLNLYTEEKDVDGGVLGYMLFQFKHCKGDPANFTFQDGTFNTPQYTVHSRAKKNESPLHVEFLDALPIA